MVKTLAMLLGFHAVMIIIGLLAFWLSPATMREIVLYTYACLVLGFTLLVDVR
jgi:hypothetical protein